MNKKYEAAKFAQRYRNRMYEAVIKALEKACLESGLNRSQIADKIGVPKSQVSRLLSGPGNWQMDTVSNLLFAIDAEMSCEVTPFSEKPKANFFNPAGQMAVDDLSNHQINIFERPTAQAAGSGFETVQLTTKSAAL